MIRNLLMPFMRAPKKGGHILRNPLIYASLVKYEQKNVQVIAFLP